MSFILVVCVSLLTSVRHLLAATSMLLVLVLDTLRYYQVVALVRFF